MSPHTGRTSVHTHTPVHAHTLICSTHAQSHTHMRTHTRTSLSTCALLMNSLRLRDGGTSRERFRPCPLPPSARPAPWPGMGPTHRHGLAAVQGMDGRLGLGVGGELHKGTACPERRRMREGQRGLSGRAGAAGEGTGSPGWLVRQSEQRDSQ